MCRLPVTFGGGSTIEYGGLSLDGVGGEVAGVDPALVQLALYRGRVPRLGQGTAPLGCRAGFEAGGHLDSLGTTGRAAVKPRRDARAAPAARAGLLLAAEQPAEDVAEAAAALAAAEHAAQDAAERVVVAAAAAAGPAEDAAEDVAETAAARGLRLRFGGGADPLVSCLPM